MKDAQMKGKKKIAHTFYDNIFLNGKKVQTKHQESFLTFAYFLCLFVPMDHMLLSY